MRTTTIAARLLACDSNASTEYGPTHHVTPDPAPTVNAQVVLTHRTVHPSCQCAMTKAYACAPTIPSAAWVRRIRCVATGLGWRMFVPTKRPCATQRRAVASVNRAAHGANKACSKVVLLALGSTTKGTQPAACVNRTRSVRALRRSVTARVWLAAATIVPTTWCVRRAEPVWSVPPPTFRSVLPRRPCVRRTTSVSSAPHRPTTGARVIPPCVTAPGSV